jgi:hypothetical protein
VLIGACVAALAWVRSAVAERYSRLRETSDSYALPTPERTRVMTLGYRSAVADFIYAHVLVSYGLHFGEKRRFEHVGDYLETITYLDPQFVQPYLFADALLTLQPEAPRREDYERARELLLRGTQALPYHQEVWFVAGQFIAYIAPPHLDDPDLESAWKLEGAKLLARACELASNNERIPHHCVVAARLLNQAGEREAMIQMLERTVAVNDDPEIQRLANATLKQWENMRDETTLQRERAIMELRAADLPYQSKDALLLLGPPLELARCAGLPPGSVPSSVGCSGSWRDWVAPVSLAAAVTE